MATSSPVHELKDLRRIGIRGGLLLLPFLLAPLLELFVFPIDFFTFRVWEAALATPYRYPGPFYPNLHISKAKEYGDYYRSGNPSEVQAKPVEWFTDAYGWRNRPDIEKKEKYDVVVLGDSNIVGSFLDQKDMVSEVIGARSGKTAYSYSIGHDHVALFFSDPRLLQKSPSLLVVETKVGNWNSTDSYLSNFRTTPDGSLEIIDRSTDFTNIFYSATRNPSPEKFESRLSKQVAFHWLKASMASDFSFPVRNKGELFIGQSAMLHHGNGWQPRSWVVSNETVKPIIDVQQPALSMRATGPNAYWHTERFVASQPDGKIVVRFDAKNSVAPTPHRVWIFEDGSYHAVGEFVAASSWRTFEIPISTNLGSILELQIDQSDAWQWLSIRDIQVLGGSSLSVVKKESAALPMVGWLGQGVPCKEIDAGTQYCRQWLIAGTEDYFQTPVLPQPGKDGLLIHFEARANKISTSFTPISLFEGDKSRVVANYVFSSAWEKFSLVLKPDATVATKLKIDFPDAVDSLSVRNFQAIPVDSLN